MYELKVTEKVQVVKRTFATMNLGEVGRVTEKGVYTGEVVLRAYNGIVSLSNPGHVWSNSLPDVAVELFRRHDTITLTFE